MVYAMQLLGTKLVHGETRVCGEYVNTPKLTEKFIDRFSTKIHASSVFQCYINIHQQNTLYPLVK